MAEVDTSSYPQYNAQSFNPLQTFGQYAQIRNALIQNQIYSAELPAIQAKAQYATQVVNGQQKAAQYFANSQDANGNPDVLGAIQKIARDPDTSLPEVLQAAYNLSNTQLEKIQSGFNQGGGQRMVTRNQANIEAAQASSPQGQSTSQQDQSGSQSQPMTQASSQPAGIPGSLPQGYTSPLGNSRETYNQIKAQAESAPDKLAAFNEIVNLNDAGAKTGTSIASMYQRLAQTGLVPQGITDQAQQTQLIGKYIHRAYADNLPNSDYRAGVLESSQLSPEQLSGTIHDLVPFMQASTQGLIAKQAYYNKQTKNGTDLTGEPTASQQWNQNYDPRWLEFGQIKNKADQRAFLVKHPDMIDKRSNYQNLQGMGVFEP